VSGGPNFVSILRGNGSGGFAAPVNASTGDYPIAVALGDLTGDHRLEIATADHLDNTITVLRNTLSAVSAPQRPTPTAFAFGPVMPNPSFGTLSVAFSVPRRAHVRIALHDIMGRRVAVLADADFPAGRHEASWSTPQEVAVRPGVYLVRCEMGGRSFAERVTVRR
jgi:hypothetical protein